MELTLNQALRKGIEAHKAGKTHEADRYYTAILKVDPKHPKANHSMGMLAVDVGKVEEALPFYETALETNPEISQYWLSYIIALIKLNRMADARSVFDQAKGKGIKGDGFDQLKKRHRWTTSNYSNVQEPSQKELNWLINLHNENRFQQVLKEAQRLTKRYAKSLALWNLIGVSAAKIGQLEYAVTALQKAIKIKPDCAEAYNNMGNALRGLGKLEEAITAYTNALSIKPNYVEAYNNIGNALKDGGKLNEAIDAYDKAISIKSDHAHSYNNKGNVLKSLGKLDEAIKVYNKAISIKPDYAEAHRNLSHIKQYTVEDKQFSVARALYKKKDLTEDTRCNLSFALAKMYEDVDDIKKSFSCLIEGNNLRKKLLNYSIDQDKNLFANLIKSQPFLLKNSVETQHGSDEILPVFIVGMPRSGTTLVEQIISSHSKVTGAGELHYIQLFGFKLATEPAIIANVAVSEFRERYLTEVSKLSNGKKFVTDKMPQNFRFIPLICAAFPEAKIIHVQRNAAATCWSNYKQYFVSKDLGYCHDLNDVVEYYKLYSELMTIWLSKHFDRIYNLSYEKLVHEQEKETRRLIECLDLTWEDACLSPHKNKRTVRTASLQQVRRKVYQGSSNAWRKYEPYLNGAFDSLPSS